MTVHPFSRREWEVILLLVEGLAPKEMALRLGVKYDTITQHMSAARKRTGARTNEQLIVDCYEQGWIMTPERVEEWPKITPAQRCYLDAFDRMLRTRSGSEEERRARLEMRYMLGAMYIEKDAKIQSRKAIKLALAA